MTRVILASSSPRRKQLLKQTGLDFEVILSEYIEDNSLPLPPNQLVQHLAEGKAQWVSKRYPDAVVIAADTLVVVDGRVYGKPADANEVRAMISVISGRWHSVMTGLAIYCGDQKVIDVSESHVHMVKLSTAQIDDYSRLSEPLDKAGAYGIQSTGALFVDRLEGDYAAVLGLPVALLAENLRKFGIELLDFAGQ